MFVIETREDGSIHIEGDAAQLMGLCQTILEASQACSQSGVPSEAETGILDEDGVRPVSVRCTRVARID